MVKLADLRCEDLLAERALVRRREREEGQEAVQHALEEPRNTGKHTELALDAHDGLQYGPQQLLAHAQQSDKEGRRTTQISGAMKSTSACAGKSAMRSRAVRCSAVCCAMSARCLDISDIRRRTS